MEENEMEIDKIKLTQIEPADYNPRTITVEDKKKLRNSLETFGLVDPIIINLKNNRIIGGHQRYDVLLDMVMESENLAEKEYALIKHGDYGFIFEEEAPTLENEDYEKALNLALNKISGEWDYEKLGSLLDELSLTELDVSITGFEDFEINELQFEELDYIFDNDYSDADMENDFDDVQFEDTDLKYKIVFNNSVDQELFYKFVEIIKDKYNKDTISQNIMSFLKEEYPKIENKNIFNAEYVIIFNDDEEKKEFFEYLTNLKLRYDEKNVSAVIKFIKEVNNGLYSI